MNNLYTHCGSCDKRFKKKDEIIRSVAGGGEAFVHTECHYDYLLHIGVDMPEYFNTYEEMIAELKEDGRMDLIFK